MQSLAEAVFDEVGRIARESQAERSRRAQRTLQSIQELGYYQAPKSEAAMPKTKKRPMAQKPPEAPATPPATPEGSGDEGNEAA